MGSLDHKQLAIIKGIGKTPGDNFSAENDPVSVNLMGGIITLLDWSPNIAPSKAIWADSPVSDGRTLIGAASGNVIEKLVILITDSSQYGMMKTLSGLLKMVQDCRDFWRTETQLDPVYLAWWAGCGAGPQYALISNMDIVPEYKDSSNPTVQVVVNIEREPYWRAIPPGANPKIWSYYVNPSHPQYNVNAASLITGSDHLINQTVQNKFEWTPASDGAQTVPLSQNYIDINASQVPGDAPALVQLTVVSGVNGLYNLYMAMSDKQMSKTNHLGVTKANALTLAAGDGIVQNGAVKNVVAAGTGLLSNNSSVNYTDVSKALALGDTAYTTYLMWGYNEISATNILELDKHFYAGTYAIFLTAFGATEYTTQKARITFSEMDFNGAASLNTQSIQFTDIPIPVNAGAASLIYVGQIMLPFSQKESVSLLGYGTQIRETVGNMYVRLELKNSSGAARTVRIKSLILMPIDNGMSQIFSNNPGSGTPSIQFIVDNTGYLSHGKTDPSSITYQYNNVGAGISASIRGALPTLKPYTNQRLYFCGTDFVTAETYIPSDTYSVKMNIVPRWAGIRDV